MCGIAGFVESPASRASSSEAYDRLDRMLRDLQHRGPDDWGMTFFGYGAGALRGQTEKVSWLHSTGIRLALGHRRLSILDLTAAGRQPMQSRDGRFWITFNGEIYNFVELRAELSRYVEFQTGTDTEVLLAAYTSWGIGMLDRLDGMYAFALWDGAAKKLICARDPMGIKPFYFAQNEGSFVFASEPRAVLGALGTRGHIDVVRLFEFLVLSVSDHDEGTSYREVRQLRGGHYLEVAQSAHVTGPKAFWKPPQDELELSSEAPALVRESITTSVSRQLRSDVAVGSCLSGGLDSGTVVATAGSLLGERAGSFTALSLVNRDFAGDESELASATARRVGVDWKKVEPETPRVAQEIESMARSMDEPFPSLSMFGQRKVMQRARELNLKVMLDGQGGDEVFLGYARVFRRVINEYLMRGEIQSALREWQSLRSNASQPLLQTLISNFFFSSPRLLHWYNQLRISGIVDRDFLRAVRPDVVRRMYAGDDGMRGIQIGELLYFCLPQLLRFEDRNSMAFGVEARVPLLSLAVVELGIRLPLRWKVRDGWSKYALRMALKDRLPENVVWSSQKRGFEVPQRRWIEAARPEIENWLSDMPSHSPIRASKILEEIDAGRGGQPWLLRCLSAALWMHFSGATV